MRILLLFIFFAHLSSLGATIEQMRRDTQILNLCQRGLHGAGSSVVVLDDFKSIRGASHGDQVSAVVKGLERDTYIINIDRETFI